ncbi:hypothetical protein QE152_g10876 [Popillia japonica]|uniref:Uncharacterized protein n=1 Tax=Popillia japonica TaxID=7064 RepID=A0AAW1LS85_POPJA
MKQETLQYDAIHLERRILWIFGIYSGKDFPPRNLHFLRALVTFSVLIIFVLGMFVEIIVDHNNFQVVF